MVQQLTPISLSNAALHSGSELRVSPNHALGYVRHQLRQVLAFMLRDCYKRGFLGGSDVDVRVPTL